MPSAPVTTSSSDAMSILDTITTLNQEASVRASTGTEKGRKGQPSDESAQLQMEEGEQDMSLIEEGDNSSTDGKALEGAQESMSGVLVLAVKTEDSQEQMDLEKEGLIEEVKMEEEKLGGQELLEEDKDKPAVKITGKPAEEQDDDVLKSTNQAKQKAKERIKEGELFHSLNVVIELHNLQSHHIFYICFSCCRHRSKFMP